MRSGAQAARRWLPALAVALAVPQSGCFFYAAEKLNWDMNDGMWFGEGVLAIVVGASVTGSEDMDKAAVYTGVACVVALEALLFIADESVEIIPSVPFEDSPSRAPSHLHLDDSPVLAGTWPRAVRPQAPGAGPSSGVQRDVLAPTYDWTRERRFEYRRLAPKGVVLHISPLGCALAARF